MDLQLTNRLALVTGSTAGIGFAIAALLYLLIPSFRRYLAESEKKGKEAGEATRKWLGGGTRDKEPDHPPKNQK